MRILLENEKDVYLLNGEVKKKIGWIEDNCYACNRNSNIHILRKFNALCFNKGILNFAVDRILVNLEDGSEYVIDWENVDELMSRFNCFYDNNGEWQLVIPVEMFSKKIAGKFEKGISTSRFISICNSNWEKLLKMPEQDDIFG